MRVAGALVRHGALPGEVVAAGRLVVVAGEDPGLGRQRQQLVNGIPELAASAGEEVVEVAAVRGDVGGVEDGAGDRLDTVLVAASKKARMSGIVRSIITRG